jgi:hypothetical protein
VFVGVKERRGGGGGGDAKGFGELEEELWWGLGAVDLGGFTTHERGMTG